MKIKNRQSSCVKTSSRGYSSCVLVVWVKFCGVFLETADLWIFGNFYAVADRDCSGQCQFTKETAISVAGCVQFIPRSDVLQSCCIYLQNWCEDREGGRFFALWGRMERPFSMRRGHFVKIEKLSLKPASSEMCRHSYPTRPRAAGLAFWTKLGECSRFSCMVSPY